jgi:putative heme-binding domain-containing protein
LIYLQAPDVVEKTLALLDAAPTQEEQIHYILHLRTLTNGWTMEQRKHYFSWFNKDQPGDLGDPTYPRGSGYYPWSKRKGETPQHSAELMKWFKDAEREYGDGSSFPKFLAGFRKDAVATLNDDQRAELAPLIAEKKDEPAKPAVEHKFVKEWKMEDLQPALDQVSTGRSFSKGKEAFTAAQCIIDPSKVVSEQYQNTIFTLKNGDDVTGRVAEENDQKMVVVTDPIKQTKSEVLKSDVQKRQLSKISPMPEGLANNLTREEILDLLAYLESGGKESAAMFQKK